MKAILVEHKQGELSVVGDYVGGDDGELYFVKKWASNIYIDSGNRCVNAIVELADWDEVDEGWESGCRAGVEQ